ncbi:EAL domain-containing protein [Leptospira sp. 96542]|nr:EAL domain-containing protein [Leptospira sp. 96542]
MLTPADLGWDASSWSDVAADCLIHGIAQPRERKLRAATGVTVHVESTAYLRRDAAGQPQGLWEVLHDITERKNAEAQLILSAEAFARHTEGVLLTDADMMILTANDAFSRTSGYSREELRGQRPSMLKSGKHDARFYAQMRDAIAEHGWWQGGIWNRHKNGELFFKWLTVNTVRDAEGTLTHYIGTYRDAVAVRAAQRHIEYLATHDPTTQLPNAVLFEDRIQFTLQRLRNSSRMLGIVVLEVEDLQRISNAAGAAVGEQVLKDVVERLRAESRDCLAVARLSREQFGTLLETDNAAALAHYCQRLRQALNAPYLQAGRQIAAPVAIGVSTAPSDGVDAQTLLLKAHAALNRAKALETQGYQFFGAEMERQITEGFEMENGLRQALSRDEFFLEYQAQVSSTDGGVGGCEALIRWRRGGGTVPPGVFIPVAEASNLIVPITEWVLRQACRDITTWDAHGVRIPTVSVNISARHFQLDTMVASLIGITRDEGVDPARICLEITEGALAEPEQSEAKLLALRQAGFALSVDDFGTGFSSLSYLKRFELDELKIDRSFIQGIEGDHGDRALVNAILSIAQGLGLTTVAEGVETEAQLRYLAERGCALIQGYLFMRPSDAGTVEAFARTRWKAKQDGFRPADP